MHTDSCLRSLRWDPSQGRRALRMPEPLPAQEEPRSRASHLSSGHRGQPHPGAHPGALPQTPSSSPFSRPLSRSTPGAKSSDSTLHAPWVPRPPRRPPGHRPHSGHRSLSLFTSPAFSLQSAHPITHSAILLKCQFDLVPACNGFRTKTHLNKIHRDVAPVGSSVLCSCCGTLDWFIHFLSITHTRQQHQQCAGIHHARPSFLPANYCLQANYCPSSSHIRTSRLLLPLKDSGAPPVVLLELVRAPMKASVHYIVTVLSYLPRSPTGLGVS